MTVQEMAKQLGDAISVSDEFKAYAEAENAFYADEQAQAMINEYNEKCSKYSKEMQREDIKPTEMINIRRKMSAEYKKLLENEIISAFMTSKEKAEKLLSEVNDIIHYCVTGEQQHDGHSCSGSCSTCGGCH